MSDEYGFRIENRPRGCEWDEWSINAVRSQAGQLEKQIDEQHQITRTILADKISSNSIFFQVFFGALAAGYIVKYWF